MNKVVPRTYLMRSLKWLVSRKIEVSYIIAWDIRGFVPGAKGSGPSSQYFNHYLK
jgi:hypothetical protein